MKVKERAGAALMRGVAWARQQRRVLPLALVGAALVGIEVAVLYPRYSEVCTTTKQTGNRHCALHHVALAPVIEIGDFFENHDGVIGAIGTLAIAFFTFTLWRTTRGTLTHLRREFEAEHRPWIPADIQLASGWKWNAEGEGRVTLRFTLRNIGRSPATNVKIRTEMFPQGRGFPDPAAAQKKLSQSERGESDVPGEGMGETIFPGSALLIKDISMGISAADREKALVAWKETMKFSVINMIGFWPIIVGCITYRFLGEKHQTGFILALNRVDPATPNTIFVLDPAVGDVPQIQLRLGDFWGVSAVID